VAQMATDKQTYHQTLPSLNAPIALLGQWLNNKLFSVTWTNSNLLESQGDHGTQQRKLVESAWCSSSPQTSSACNGWWV